MSVSRDVVFDEKWSSQKSRGDETNERELTLPSTARGTQEEVIIDADEDEEAEGRDNERVDGGGTGQAIQREPLGTPEPKRRELRDRKLLKEPNRYIEELDFSEYKPPETYREAVSGSESEKWLNAIEIELQAHEKNKTWTVVKKKSEMKIIDSKWVFKVVREKTSDKLRYKARLCARAFCQKQGIDYNETFAPVIRYDSLRTFLARVTQDDLEMLQFDVCTAFLYGELDEEIFLKVPEGLTVESDVASVVCRLNKSLYG